VSASSRVCIIYQRFAWLATRKSRVPRTVQISRGDGPGGRPERRRRVLHDGRVHAGASATVAVGRPVQRPARPVAQGQQGPVLHRPRRRAVPVRVGLPAGRQAVASRELPGKGAAPARSGLLPAGRSHRAAPRTEARLHHRRLSRHVRIRPGRAVRRQLPQDTPDTDMRPRATVSRRVRRLAQREQRSRPRGHGSVHGQVGVHYIIFVFIYRPNRLHVIIIIINYYRHYYYCSSILYLTFCPQFGGGVFGGRLTRPVFKLAPIEYILFVD